MVDRINSLSPELLGQVDTGTKSNILSQQIIDSIQDCMDRNSGVAHDLNVIMVEQFGRALGFQLLRERFDTIAGIADVDGEVSA